MKPDSKSVRGMGRVVGWRRAFPWLRIVLGALAVLVGARVEPVSAASEADKPSTTEVPASWQAFARLLQLRFQEQLSSDNDNAVRLRESMAKLGQAGPAAPTLIVRAWVLPDGKVARVELEGTPNENALHDLSAALMGDAIGTVPPDMPQPVRLRLSLGAKLQPEN
jgi:hypothetical protein